MTEFQVRAFGSSRFVPWQPVDAVGAESAAQNFVGGVLQPITAPSECWQIHVDNPAGERRMYEVRMVDKRPEYFVELETE